MRAAEGGDDSIDLACSHVRYSPRRRLLNDLAAPIAGGRADTERVEPGRMLCCGPNFDGRRSLALGLLRPMLLPGSDILAADCPGSCSAEDFTCAAGDWDGDGKMDFAVGNFSWKRSQPFGDAATLWNNVGGYAE